MTLPTLYKKASDGKLQVWNISVEGSIVITSYGDEGGKQQEARDLIKVGKNTGKKNATTPEQQAEAEAQSKWNRQVERKGYVADRERASRGETDAEGGIAPMLAHKFSEQGHKIVYSAFDQPKLDGERCTADYDPTSGTCSLWTRSRKPITGVPHINRAVEKQLQRFKGMRTDHIILDGELYNHEYRNRFEELMSFIRSATPKPGHEVVEFHIYDFPSEADKPFKARIILLIACLGIDLEKGLVLVETRKVEDEERLMEHFEYYRQQGYEGLMVRNADGLYVNKRSADLLKIKEFDDDEWKVVGVYEGRGKTAGCGILICAIDPNSPDVGAITPETAEILIKKGQHFAVKMKGDLDNLRPFFLDYEGTAKGRWVTVQYQGLTNKNKLPRFPVGVRFKD